MISAKIVLRDCFVAHALPMQLLAMTARVKRLPVVRNDGG